VVDRGLAWRVAGVVVLLTSIIPAGAMAIDCYEPGSALEKSACAVDSLRDQMLEIDLVSAQVGAALSPAEADTLRMQKAAWTQEILAMCGVEAMVAAGREQDESLALCLGDHFQEWREWLARYHRRIGRHEIVARSIARWDRDRYYEVRIQYPELLDPAGAGEEAFNRWAAAEAEGYAEGFETSEFVRSEPVSDEDRQSNAPSTLRRSYRMELAGEGLIAVTWDDYVYGTGAAHGIPSTRGVLFSLDAARPLSAADVFAADADWAERATELCLPRLAKQIADTETGFTPEAVRKIVAEFGSWSFGARGATITFDVYTIASYASGVIECRLSYEELRPILNPSLSIGLG
jgi:Protein of unknown function (DUF3298)